LTNEAPKALRGSAPGPNSINRFNKYLLAVLAIDAVFVDLQPKTDLPKGLIANSGGASAGFDRIHRSTLQTGAPRIEFGDLPNISTAGSLHGNQFKVVSK